MGWFIIIIIIIIIINEKINVAFSRRTARTRNSHKNKSRENVVSNSTEEKNSHENDCSKSSVFSCRLNISNDGCDVSVAGKLFQAVYLDGLNEWQWVAPPPSPGARGSGALLAENILEYTLQMICSGLSWERYKCVEKIPRRTLNTRLDTSRKIEAGFH